MTESRPFYISQRELDDCPPVGPDNSVLCPHCGERHKLIPPDDWIQAYHCGERLCLGAIAGRDVTGKLKTENSRRAE